MSRKSAAAFVAAIIVGALALIAFVFYISVGSD
jgi:hypothetical protein